MLRFEFIPDEEYRDTHPDVSICWKGCEEWILDEYVEKFQQFLRAISFTDKQAESVQIVKECDCTHNTNEKGRLLMEGEAESSIV